MCTKLLCDRLLHTFILFKFLSISLSKSSLKKCSKQLTAIRRTIIFIYNICVQAYFKKKIVSSKIQKHLKDKHKLKQLKCMSSF